jgi:rhodanese-related sulfurtransferase
VHYLVATYVFMLPGAIAYTWIGYAGREAVAGGEGMARNILIALALLAAVAFLPRVIAAIRRGPTLDIAQLRQRIDEDGTLVLDVRTAEEFIGEQGHIDGAMNIAVEQLPARLHELADYTQRPIALVCRTDMRSAKAAILLAKQGFHDVHVVRGGMMKWAEAGLPVVHG